MSGPEIVKAAELHVYESNLFVPPDRRPCDHGILDTRLVCYEFFISMFVLFFATYKL